MSIESVGAYSPDTVYGQLTSPFLKKMVHINAHPSAVAAEQTSRTVSLNNFIPTKANARVDVEKITSAGAARTQEINEGTFPPDPSDTDETSKLTHFSSSEIVGGALKKGYSAQQAIVISNASQAYASASKIGVAKLLSTHSHRV